MNEKKEEGNKGDDQMLPLKTVDPKDLRNKGVYLFVHNGSQQSSTGMVTLPDEDQKRYIVEYPDGGFETYAPADLNNYTILEVPAAEADRVIKEIQMDDREALGAVEPDIEIN
jgi:hypothetical protein